MIGRIINGLIGIGLGALAVVYARKIVEFTGVSATLERYLGDGGTYMGVRILGILVILYSFLSTFGLLDSFASSVGRAIFGG